MSDNKTIYSVFTRLRSKYLEMTLPKSEICIYDQTDIVFQSFSLEKAKEYYDSISHIETDYWYSISKSLIVTPLDRDCVDGFYNETTITQCTFK